MRIKLNCEHFATWCGLRTQVAVITCSRSAVIVIPAVYSSSVSKSLEVSPTLSKEVEDSEDEESEDVELEDNDKLEDVFDITGD